MHVQSFQYLASWTRLGHSETTAIRLGLARALMNARLAQLYRLQGGGAKHLLGVSGCAGRDSHVKQYFATTFRALNCVFGQHFWCLRPSCAPATVQGRRWRPAVLGGPAGRGRSRRTASLGAQAGSCQIVGPEPTPPAAVLRTSSRTPKSTDSVGRRVARLTSAPTARDNEEPPGVSAGGSVGVVSSLRS